MVKYCAASVAFKCSTGYRQGREGMRRVVVKYYAASAVFKSSTGYRQGREDKKRNVNV